MSVTLYDIESHLEALAETVETVEPEQEQQFLADFAAALRAAVDKRDAVARFLAHLEANISLADAEVDRLKERQAKLCKVKDRVEMAVTRTIESLGFDDQGRYKKLEGSVSTFALNGCPPAVEITDQEAVPRAYKRLTIQMPAELWDEIAEGFDPEMIERVQEEVTLKAETVDKRAIKADIDAGAEVPGADLLINRFALRRT